MAGENCKNYLFLCGVPRSGTTALVKILNKHDDICIGVERFKYIAMQSDKVSNFNEDLFNEDRFFDVKSEDTNVIIGDIYKKIKSKYRFAKVVGDKVPRYYMKLKLIWDRFPNSKIIYIVRDLKSVANSWNARAANPNDAWPDANNYARAVGEWNSANGIALKAAQQKPKQFLIVKYEEIFPDGVSLMENLLRSIDLEIDDQFRAAYRAVVNEPRKSGRKTVYEGQDQYLEAHADFGTYNAVLDRRLRA